MAAYRQHRDPQSAEPKTSKNIAAGVYDEA
jgi:hypothetical protein